MVVIVFTLVVDSMTPTIPILRPFLTTIVLLLYLPCMSGSRLSSMFATMMGEVMCSRKGTTPAILSSNS